MTVEAFKPKDPKEIISKRELPNYLADGWDVQTFLPGGKILVRRNYKMG